MKQYVGQVGAWPHWGAQLFVMELVKARCWDSPGLLGGAGAVGQAKYLRLGDWGQGAGGLLGAGPLPDLVGPRVARLD